MIIILPRPSGPLLKWKRSSIDRSLPGRFVQIARDWNDTIFFILIPSSSLKRFIFLFLTQPLTKTIWVITRKFINFRDFQTNVRIRHDFTKLKHRCRCCRLMNNNFPDSDDQDKLIQHWINIWKMMVSHYENNSISFMLNF